MIGETICLLLILVSGIVFIARLGFLQKIFSKLLGDKILDKISYLKVSAPNLKSTSDNHNSKSP